LQNEFLQRAFLAFPRPAALRWWKRPNFPRYLFFILYSFFFILFFRPAAAIGSLVKELSALRPTED
jgi:hypothetical protein